MREECSTLQSALHWNAQHLIRPGHLRNSLLFAGFLFLTLLLSYGVSGGLSYGVSNGLSYALSYGLGYWLLFGISQGIIQEQVEDRDRRTFNQGIRRSLFNGFLTSLFGGGIILGIGMLSVGLSHGLIVGLSHGLSNGLSHGLSYALSNGLSYGSFLAVSGGLLAWTMVGGLTVFQHYLIRLLLARTRTFPWRAQAFLDATTVHILLQRVGGGYSFVHRRLLDYFAEIDITLSKVATQPVAETSTRSSRLSTLNREQRNQPVDGGPQG